MAEAGSATFGKVFDSETGCRISGTKVPCLRKRGQQLTEYCYAICDI